VAAANAIEKTNPDEAGEAVKSVADTSGGQVVLVNRRGDIVARAGKEPAASFPDPALEAASRGERIKERFQGRWVATVPVVRDGRLRGGVAFVSGNDETAVLEIFYEKAARC